MKKIHIKFVALVLIFSTLLIAHPKTARADTWGANMMAAIWKDTTEKITTKIKETIIANLKIAAIRLVQGRIMTLLTGSPGQYGFGGGSLVISDWRDYIYGTAQRYSYQVTNDFFSNQRAGTPGILAQRIIDPAQKAVMMDYWNMRPDLQNYVAGGDASKIFTPGYTNNPWFAWRKAAEPQNDVGFMLLRGEGVLTESFRQEEEKQKTSGQAGQGYKGLEKNTSSQEAMHAGTGGATGFEGATATSTQNITTPGSTIKAITDEIMSMPIKMLTLARSIPEIATNMIASTITQVIQQGVTQITAPIDQRIMQMRNQALGTIYSATSGIPIAGPMVNASVQNVQNIIQSGAARSNVFFSR